MFIDKKISIVIPCFNEEKTIIQTLQKSIESIKKLTKYYQIIIVDDFSNDQSREKLKIYEKDNSIDIIFHERNYRKGKALKTAFEKVNGEYIIIQDADLEYSPDDYKNLLVPFVETDADVVYGSRFLGGGKYVRLHFFWHYLANRFLTFLCNLSTNVNMTDMETGFKVFKSKCLKKIFLEEDRFGFEPEFTIKLAKQKFKFYEVAISYQGRSYEDGKKIGLKDAFRALYCIIKYSFKT